jgi:hypothetical protein
VSNAVGSLETEFEDTFDMADVKVAESATATRDWADQVTGDFGRGARSFGKVGEASGDMADDIKEDTRSSAEKFHDMVKSMRDDADDLIDKAYDPIIDHNKLVATNIEIAATKASIASGKLKGDQIRDAHDTLDSLRKDQAEYVLALAAAGQTQSGAYAKAMTELKNQIKNTSGPAKVALIEILNKIREIERAGKVIPLNFVFSQKMQDFRDRKDSGFATGGTVPGPKGQPRLVVAHGGERIQTENQQRNDPATGGGSFTVNVNVSTAVLTPAIAEQLKQQLRPVFRQLAVESNLIPRGSF